MENPIVPQNSKFPPQIPIIPLEGPPLFPGMITQMMVQQQPILHIIKVAEQNDGFVGLVMMKEPQEDDPYTFKNLHTIGTLAKINKQVQLPDEGQSVFLALLERFKIVEPISMEHPLIAKVEYISTIKQSTIKKDPELVALTRSLISAMKEIIANNPVFSEDVRLNMVNIDHPGKIADFTASILNLKRDEQQEILESINLHERIIKVLTYLNREKKYLQIQNKIQNQISEHVEKHKREHFLREMLKEIKSELGEPVDGQTEEVKEFQQKLNELPIEDEIRMQIQKEIDKFAILSTHHPEYHVYSTYLGKILDLPWKEPTPKNINIAYTQKILDKHHFGMESVKERIIEYLAVKKIEQSEAKSIICLVGPPGVGKTSIARSIALALDKKLYHFSVGGMRDEAEIKGHRRTYIGAMPGKIMQGLLSVKEKDPVYVIDEIDKISNSMHGDPSSALLEVLDPVQNSHFRDLYMDIPFDLSQIFFITTANTTHTIPKPLLDRMEVIELSGYIDEEKLSIAKKYIVPKSLKTHGLKTKDIVFTTNALKYIAENYAREAGMRAYEQCVNKIVRKSVTAIMKQDEKQIKKPSSSSDKTTKQNSSTKISSHFPLQIDTKDIETYLGIAPFRENIHNRASMPGTSLGLAWTSVGGDVLVIEAQALKGKKSFKLTGTLGDVMKESAQIAYTLSQKYLETIDDGLAEKYKIQKQFFEENEIHLHVPQGATPKDGPSAGITMSVALLSLATNMIMTKNFAMTGELSLMEKVLPIGGLREKIVAAQRNQIKNIIIPQANTTDLMEIPKYITKKVNVYPVSTLQEVFTLLLPKLHSHLNSVQALQIQ